MDLDRFRSVISKHKNFLISATAGNQESVNELLFWLKRPFDDRTLEIIGGKNEVTRAVKILATQDFKYIVDIFENAPKFDRYGDYFGINRGLWIGMIPYLYDIGIINYINCHEEFIFILDFIKNKDEYMYYTRLFMDDEIRKENSVFFLNNKSRKKIFSDNEKFRIDNDFDRILISMFRFRIKEIEVLIPEDIFSSEIPIEFIHALVFEKFDSTNRTIILERLKAIVELPFFDTKYLITLVKILNPDWYALW